jgi:hypothetical protein
MDRPVRAGAMRLPENYYPDVQHSYQLGSVFITDTNANSIYGSVISLDFPAYLVSIEVTADSHQNGNYYTLEIVKSNGAVDRKLFDRIFDSGQKVIPLVIPELLPAGYQLRLSMTNTLGIKQLVMWHANFVY